MPSHYQLSGGAFAGNCAPDAPPPPGHGYTPDDPPPGIWNPWFDGAAWNEGEIPEPDQPQPNYTSAWQELTVGPVWQWINFTAAVAEDVQLVMAVSNLQGCFQGWRDSDPEIWKLGMAACCEALYNRLAAINQPLPQEHRDWLSDWRDRNHLGLTLCWEDQDE